MLITSKQAAQLLGLTPGAFNVHRHRGSLPIPFIRFGKRCIRYRLEDVEAYLAEHRVEPKNEKSPTDSDKSAG